MTLHRSPSDGWPPVDEPPHVVGLGRLDATGAERTPAGRGRRGTRDRRPGPWLGRCWRLAVMITGAPVRGSVRTTGGGGGSDGGSSGGGGSGGGAGPGPGGRSGAPARSRPAPAVPGLRPLRGLRPGHGPTAHRRDRLGRGVGASRSGGGAPAASPPKASLLPPHRLTVDPVDLVQAEPVLVRAPLVVVGTASSGSTAVTAYPALTAAPRSQVRGEVAAPGPSRRAARATLVRVTRLHSPFSTTQNGSRQRRSAGGRADGPGVDAVVPQLAARLPVRHRRCVARPRSAPPRMAAT